MDLPVIVIEIRLEGDTEVASQPGVRVSLAFEFPQDTETEQ